MIVVTGGTGFVGSNLTNRIVHNRMGAILIDKGDIFSRLVKYKNKKNIQIHHIDLCSDNFDEFIPKRSTIIHLAALPHVDYSMYFPDKVLLNNINSTLSILRVARYRDCKILFGSSVEVYGNSSDGILIESSRLNPRSPYACSKVVGEKLVSNYCKTYNIPYTIVRFTNLYGPLQLPDRLISRVISQQVNNILSEVDACKERDYLYIDDAVDALLKIIFGELWTGNVYNISSGISFENHYIADLISRYSENRVGISKIDERLNDGRGSALRISSNTLQNTINWKPHTSINEGIQKTFEWYKCNLSWLNQFEKPLRSDRSSYNFIIDAFVGNKRHI